MKHILVDVGRVLMLPKQDVQFTDKDKSILKHIEPYRHRLEIGEIKYESALEGINKIRKPMIHANDYYNVLNQNAEYNHELVNFIKKQDAKAHIASNSFQYFINRFVLENQVTEWADKIISSDAIKSKKPDKDFYLKAIQMIRASFNDCYLIDDKEENVEAFKNLGGSGITYKTNNETIEDLNKWLK